MVAVGPPGPRRSDPLTAVPAVPVPPFDQDVLHRGHVTVRADGPLLTVSLNRPQARNAQLPQTWEALAHIGSRLSAGIRVVVVTGAGRSFSAGLDRAELKPSPGSLLGTLAAATAEQADAAIASFQAGFSWLADPGIISIAAVGGHAVGAGFQLALACDLIVAADDAQFRMAEVSFGLVPDLGGTAPLVRLVGYQRALEICVTGRHVSAQEAVRIGVAMVSVPVAELDAAVADLAAAVLESPPDAVRAVKALLAGVPGSTASEQRREERAAQIRLLADRRTR